MNPPTSFKEYNMSSHKQKFMVATCGLFASLNVFSSEVFDVNDINFEDDNFQKCVLAQNTKNPAKLTKLVRLPISTGIAPDSP